ncbi:hypothetical protein [Ectobacillus ponti]|uniref:hypothetical protein n=1 Tax=Ectobacillus ponti TaxID=2961894 RepID=UPI0027BA6CAC|nr:hypothetical protein [Ectobacillus ponti]
MYHQPPYGVNYYYPYPGYEMRGAEEEVYRPDDAEDAPAGPPPAQMPAMPATFGAPVQGDQLRNQMCRCLGNWGVIGLNAPGPFGRDFWFYATEIRKNGVAGYTWRNGRRQRVSYRYQQIRNFICYG